MKALAGYIVSGRWQAVLVAATSGVLGMLLLPFSCLGAATVSLVTLHVGIVSGLQVMALATAGALLLYLLAGVKAAFLISMVLLLWLPCWLVSGVLQQTRELGYALKVTSLFGACMLLLAYVLLGNGIDGVGGVSKSESTNSMRESTPTVENMRRVMELKKVSASSRSFW